MARERKEYGSSSSDTILTFSSLAWSFAIGVPCVAPTTRHLLINWLSSTDQRTGSQLLSIIERYIRVQCMHLHSCIYVHMCVCTLHSYTGGTETRRSETERDDMKTGRELVIIYLIVSFGFSFQVPSCPTINSLPLSFPVNSDVLSKWIAHLDLMWSFCSSILNAVFSILFFFFFYDSVL